MLDTLCTSRLNDQNKFIKARAAWCFRQYGEAQFRTTSILSKVGFVILQLSEIYFFYCQMTHAAQ